LAHHDGVMGIKIALAPSHKFRIHAEAAIDRIA
jgi:hypothetical protein